jgi:hypothetical protein
VTYAKAEPIGRTLTVSADGSGAYRTVGSALYGAEAGAIISILPGTYAESLVITRPCRLVAEEGPGTVTISAREGSALTMGAERAVVSGLRLTGSDPDIAVVDVGHGELTLDECAVASSGAAALFVRGEAWLHVRDSTVTSTRGIGLLMTDGARGTISSTTFDQCGGTAVLLRAGADPHLRDCDISNAAGNGVCCSDGAKGTVEHCRIGAIASPAIAVSQGSTTRFVATTVSETPSLGVYITGGARPTFERCVVEQTGSVGVMLGDRSAARFVDCTIENAADAALHFIEDAAGELVGCRIATSPVGVNAQGGAHPVIRRTEIIGCGTGMRYADGASGEVTDGSVLESEQQAVEVLAGGQLTLRRMTLQDAGAAGLLVRDGGVLGVDDCDVAAARSPTPPAASSSRPVRGARSTAATSSPTPAPRWS